jgi:hypothetical protein
VIGIKEYTSPWLTVAVRDVYDHNVLFITLIAMYGAGLNHVAQASPCKDALQYFGLCGVWCTDANTRSVLQVIIGL